MLSSSTIDLFGRHSPQVWLTVSTPSSDLQSKFLCGVIDTGSDLSLIPQDALLPSMLPSLRPCPLSFIRTANGGTCKILGVIDLNTCFYVLPQGRRPAIPPNPTPEEVVPGLTFPACFIVIDSLSVDMLLGMDFLRHFSMGLLVGAKSVQLSVPREVRGRMPPPNILDWMVNSADPVVMAPSVFVGDDALDNATSLRSVYGSSSSSVRSRRRRPRRRTKRRHPRGHRVPTSSSSASCGASTSPLRELPHREGLQWSVPVPKMVSKAVQSSVVGEVLRTTPPSAPVLVREPTSACSVGPARSVSSAASRKEQSGRVLQQIRSQHAPEYAKVLQASLVVPPVTGPTLLSSIIPDKGLSDAVDWPGEGVDADELDGDDLAAALEFAVPDFQSNGVDLPNLPDEPKYRPYQALCSEFSDLFSKRPGRCDHMQHEIHLKKDKPIAEKVRRVPHKWRNDVEEMINEMLAADVIELSSSSYRFPCVYVPKKDGRVRMCIDYRELNKVVDLDAYPVPRPDDVQEHLKGAKVFSTLDLRSGYWQMLLRPDDREKTAFCPGPGFPLYQWKRVAFGLSNAPASFQRLMHFELGDLPFVRIYLDDVLVFSPDEETHLKHLRVIFERLRSANLTLAPDKCDFGQPEVEYLGHVFDEVGMKPSLSKVSAITTWPVPETTAELRSFLGLAGYYRKFIDNYSVRERPLRELLAACKRLDGKDDIGRVKELWSDQHDATFLELKTALARLPYLMYPDFERPFQIFTDACDYAIGGVLEQDGRPLGYFSRSLTGPQLNWPTYEKEAYALLKTLEFFRHFVLGYPLEVVMYTDHRPLTWISKASSPKVTRWLLALQAYRFTVRYREGTKHVNADALSRIRSVSPVHNESPLVGVVTAEQLGCGLTTDVDFLNEAVTDVDRTVTRAQSVTPNPCAVTPAPSCPIVCILSVAPRWTKEELRQAQQRDPTLSLVFERRLDPAPLARNELVGPEFSPYKKIWGQLEVVDGVLVRLVRPLPDDKPRLVPVVPQEIRSEVLLQFHDDDGHFGKERVGKKLVSLCYWPGMLTAVADYICSCQRCKLAKHKVVPPMDLVTIPVGRPWHTVAIDFLSLSTPVGSFSKLLVIVDYFTKFAEAFPVTDETAASAVAPLYALFGHFGPPQRVLSDNGPAFESKVFEKVLTGLGCKRAHCTVYHPQGNGLVERFNGTVLGMLRTHIDHSYDWLGKLRTVLWCYNTSVHASTGHTPFYLMFGREPNIGYFPPLNDAYDLHDPISWSEQQQRVRARIQDTVDLYVSYAGARQKYFYDQKAKRRVFFVGQKVQLKRFPNSRGRADKLLSGWEDGWYIKRIMPGRVVKAVEVLHEATDHSKVISVDLIHIDPLQPPHPPPHMGIVRHLPPPVEDPRLPEHPLRFDGSPRGSVRAPTEGVPSIPDVAGADIPDPPDRPVEGPAAAQDFDEFDVWELLPEERAGLEDPVDPNPEGEVVDEAGDGIEAEVAPPVEDGMDVGIGDDPFFGAPVLPYFAENNVPVLPGTPVSPGNGAGDNAVSPRAEAPDLLTPVGSSPPSVGPDSAREEDSPPPGSIRSDDVCVDGAVNRVQEPPLVEAGVNDDVGLQGEPRGIARGAPSVGWRSARVRRAPPPRFDPSDYVPLAVRRSDGDPSN